MNFSFRRCGFASTCFIGLCLSASLAHAQNVVFTGKVVSSTGQPLKNVHVLLGDSRYFDITDSRGMFGIENVTSGEYTLTVRRLGYETYRSRVKIGESDLSTSAITLKEKRYRTETVVVTATRTRRDIEDVPVPVTVIKKDEISSAGSMRLSDVLAEQTGLRLTADHGTGIQVQGFNPEYTLIMLNGQPLVGRTAGTLNLDRITVGNVQQIEIIKGPSSALWGSDALAGVVNIITGTGSKPFAAGITSRYGTNSTLDLGAHLSWQRQEWQNNVFFNRNSSGGYRLNPRSISQTVPEYYNYTGSYRTKVALSDRVDIEFFGRYFRENQQSTDYLGEAESPVLLDDKAVQEDYGVSPAVTIRMAKGAELKLTHYSSAFRTERTFTYRESGDLYQEEVFDQTYNKTEAQGMMPWSTEHITTAGTGVSWEGLKSDRYEGKPDFRNLFLYAQHEWLPSERLDLIGGFRYDSHSEYGSQLSPKLSARYKVNSWLHLRASAGSGFKAPDFRQLFLNFTNPTVGYSVFGSTAAAEKIKQLQEEGKISRILIPPDQLAVITAEQSWAYNAGFDLYPTANLQWRVNIFRNNVNDMIETAPVATKTNGQSVFSYFNLEKIYTQGVETELRWDPLTGLHLSLGYQFLDAERRIQETRTIQDADGNPVSREVTSYEPMFNRSRHSGTIKLFYTYEPFGLQANIRGTWKSSYGRVDANGNGYADPGEYEDGYMLWNTAVSKTLAERYKLQLGIDNVLDFTRPQSLPYLPGRLFYAQVSLQLY